MHPEGRQVINRRAFLLVLAVAAIRAAVAASMLAAQQSSTGLLQTRMSKPMMLNAALRRLRRVPATLLRDLTQEFRVSRRTLENAISMTTGKTFREVRDEVLVKQVKNLLESRPTRGIKELCFELGYKSPRSFARAVKRACGIFAGATAFTHDLPTSSR